MDTMYAVCLSGFIFSMLTYTHAEIRNNDCPQRTGYSFMPHFYPCYFYACYDGQPFSQDVYECPTDPKYYMLLADSAHDNPCSTCPHSPVDKDSTTEEPWTPPQSTTTARRTTPGAFTTTTTTTAATTSTATESTTPGITLKDITLVLSNSHVHGAVWYGGDTTLRQCLGTCEGIPSCYGFDFDIGTSSCWLHNGLTVCAEPEVKENCTHFRLTDQCSTSTTTSLSQTTSPTGGSGPTTMEQTTTSTPRTLTFVGFHVPGGSVISLASGAATIDVCVAICRMDTECYGVDYDDVTKSCWIHDETSACNLPQAKTSCTHVRLTDICDNVPNSSPTPSLPLTTTNSLTSSTDSGQQEEVTPNLDFVPNGYFEFVEGYHIPGGLLKFADVSLRQCLDACLTTPYCLALDYDVDNRGCYFHFRESYCSAAFELPRNYHFKRLPCIEDVPNDAAATWYQFHAEGGSEFCVGCTLGSCIQACYEDPDCAGIDFDIRNLGCYHFNVSDVCGPLIPKDYCIHMSRDECVPDNLVGVPLDNLAFLSFPSPASLPSQWHAYPGISVRNGLRAGSSGMSGADCVQYCDLDPDCYSGDYNLADGTCWLHVGRSRQCAQVEANDSVFHFKKDGCDAVFGSLQPFISPVWTSP